jgi:hypothetical protein
MKVYAVVLRRVVTAAGFLFGFGLLALIMASQANAETPAPQAQGEPLSVLSPVTAVVHEALAPVTGAVHDVVAPVGKSVEPATSAVHELLAPVGKAIAPVTSPLTDTVGTLVPVLDPVVSAVAPVPESLVKPLVPAAQAGRSLPVSVPQVIAAIPVVSPDWTATVDAVRTVGARVAHGVAAVGVSQPDKAPSAPVAPLNVAPSGGSGSVGGAGGGSHGADATVSTPRNSLADNNSMGRSPPGAIVGHPWFGYDGRDRPR